MYLSAVGKVLKPRWQILSNKSDKSTTTFDAFELFLGLDHSTLKHEFISCFDCQSNEQIHDNNSKSDCKYDEKGLKKV